MNEYAASYNRVEKIVNAAQSIKVNLTCNICLELFNEPVTIKCGHKFCRNCILQVAGNENSSCPFCNIKIQKRSIPKESNELLKSSVNKFNALVAAIREDSGIDVTQPYNIIKHTKECVNENLDASFASFCNASVSSKVFPNKSKRLDSRKKQTNVNLNTKSTKNTLHKYLENNKLNEPNQQIESNEKVTKWLNNDLPKSDEFTTDSDIDVVTVVVNKNDVSSSTESKKFKENTNTISLKPHANVDKPSTIISNSNLENESNFKESLLIVQEAEMRARKKKLNQSSAENLTKTTSCVPVAAHSDAGDWKRVKKVGKEMQVKTFKSLRVSVEKNSSSSVNDDIEPCHSNFNDDKNNTSSPSKRRFSLKLKTNVAKKSNLSPQKIDNNNTPKVTVKTKSFNLTNDVVKKPVNSTLKPPVKSLIESSVKSSSKVLMENLDVPPESPKNNVVENAKNLKKNTRTVIVFKKLGRICKKRKNIPFLCIGKLAPKEKLSATNENTSKIIVKSVLPVNVDYKESLKSNKKKQSKSITCKKDLVVSSEKDSHSNAKARDVLPVVDEKKSCQTTETAKKTVTSSEIKTSIIVDKCDNSFNIKSINNKVVQFEKTELNVETIDSSEEDEIVVTKKKIKLRPIESSDDESPKILQKVKKFKKKIDVSSDENENNNNTRPTRKNNRSHKKLFSKSNNSVVKNDKCETESIASSVSTIFNTSPENNFNEKSNSNISTVSTIKDVRLKKKRVASESSEDFEDVASIIGKWCDEDDTHFKKKPKLLTHVVQVHTNQIQENDVIVDICTDEDVDVTKITKKQQVDTSLNRNDQVKNIKKKEPNTDKLHEMPSSLNSADLFDTNDQSIIQPTAQQLPNRFVKIKNENHDLDRSTSRNNNKKENLNNTVLNKDNKKIEANSLEKSNNSDKENNVYTSQNKKMNNSLINNTQKDVGTKIIEKVDFAKNDLQGTESCVEKEKLSAPTKMKPPSQQDSEMDTENIQATPVVKKRQINFSKIKAAPDSTLSSPECNSNIIPAFTPMMNTKSYPLCHSTPMTKTNLLVESANSRNIILVCSGLSPANNQVVHEFTKKFKVKFRENFTTDVTHVIVQVDLKTKRGQKTSKYIQGIAFKKYVLNFQWITDCLRQNVLLDENNEKYSVLDTDTLENGAVKSRESIKNLFEDFAFYCMEPFNAIQLKDFKSMLRFNGAIIADTLGELTKQIKIKIVILESEDLSGTQIFILKKSGGVLVSFEWIIDSISQYSVLSITPYLYETTIDEAIEMGVPEKYLEENPDEEFEQTSAGDVND